MAIYNEILVGRFNRFLQKLTAIKGNAPVPQLAGEVMPVIALFNGAENRYLEGWNRFGIADQQSAVAAQNSVFRLRNPTAVNVLAVIEKITLANQNAAAAVFQVNIGATGADLGTNDSAFTSRLDARSQVAHPSLIFSRANNVTPVGFTFWNSQLPTGAGSIVDLVLYENQEITIMPGDAIDFATGAVNLQLNASIIWRERFIEESERT